MTINIDRYLFNKPISRINYFPNYYIPTLSKLQNRVEIWPRVEHPNFKLTSLIFISHVILKLNNLKNIIFYLPLIIFKYIDLDLWEAKEPNNKIGPNPSKWSSPKISSMISKLPKTPSSTYKLKKSHPSPNNKSSLPTSKPSKDKPISNPSLKSHLITSASLHISTSRNKTITNWLKSTMSSSKHTAKNSNWMGKWYSHPSSWSQ